jgi:hypothetical protein
LNARVEEERLSAATESLMNVFAFSRSTSVE